MANIRLEHSGATFKSKIIRHVQSGLSQLLWQMTAFKPTTYRMCCHNLPSVSSFHFVRDSDINTGWIFSDWAYCHCHAPQFPPCSSTDIRRSPCPFAKKHILSEQGLTACTWDIHTCTIHHFQLAGKAGVQTGQWLRQAKSQYSLEKKPWHEK